jgi:hypothetical protein
MLVPGPSGRAAAPAVSRIFRTFSTSRSPIQPHVDFGLPWNQGWYCNDFLFNFTGNTNYVVGSFGQDECRNFFTFEVSALDRPVVAARLRVFAADLEGDPKERYGFYDVSTSPWRLNNNNGFKPAVFRDLGTGTSFGTATVDMDADRTWLTFRLNEGAIRAINDAGAFFSLGGRLLSDDHSDFDAREILFGTSGLAKAHLLVRTAPPAE